MRPDAAPLRPAAAHDAAPLAALSVQVFLDQRRGLGRHLLRASEQAALPSGLGALWFTAWDGNHRPRAFCAAFGYQDIGPTTYSLQGLTYGNRVLSRLIDPAKLPTP